MQICPRARARAISARSARGAALIARTMRRAFARRLRTPCFSAGRFARRASKLQSLAPNRTLRTRDSPAATRSAVNAKDANEGTRGEDFFSRSNRALSPHKRLFTSIRPVRPSRIHRRSPDSPALRFRLHSLLGESTLSLPAARPDTPRVCVMIDITASSIVTRVMRISNRRAI